ncbi:hypothetical protein [Sulfitobacter sp. MF3-043]|uniref:hypothetical protein n=1 Tax=Sulfitobacter sediminivivens TaxID=3252902 RepID=UPI0036D94D1B
MTNTRWENSTTLLCVLAVFFAWPTFGLSILALFGWIAWTGYSKAQKAKNRQALSVELEPVFDKDGTGDGYHSLMLSLGLPKKNESVGLTEHQLLMLKECGRLVMLYFAHNPREAKAFMEARKKFDPDEFVSPGELLQWEDSEHRSFIWGYHSRDLRLVCFHAVKALMTNNDLPCFEPFDLEEISIQIKDMSLEQKAAAKRKASIREEPSEPISQKTSLRPPMETVHPSSGRPEGMRINSPFNKASANQYSKPVPGRNDHKNLAQCNSTNPDIPEKSTSIEDYIVAQDAENGTNLSAWLNLGGGDTPEISEPRDESQTIIDEINAKAFARSQGRMEAVRNGAPTRTDSEREYACELARIKKLARKL